MRHLSIICLLLSLSAPVVAQSIKQFRPLAGISIRALEVVNDSTVWFAADRGVFGLTTDGGRSWQIDSLQIDGAYPQFRSIAVLDKETVLLLSIASPAHLMRTTDGGNSWDEVYSNAHPDVFFDSMVFTDSLQGYAISDPIEGRFLMIETIDGGKNWRETDTRQWPPPAKDEAFFASSNGNMSIADGVMRLCTGGSHSRLLTSNDGGTSFTPSDLPLPQGGKMTGAYAMHFSTSQMGAVAGGDYERTAADVPSLALTTDGGQTWRQLKGPRPFFGSSVRFRGDSEVFVTGHDGTFRFDLHNGSGTELLQEDGSPLKFHTLRISPSGRTIWLAGKDGYIGRVQSGD